MNIDQIKKDILNITQQKVEVDTILQQICDYLKSAVSYYDWVGFYFTNGDKKELILKQFAGKPTEHTVIPFGKGICGQVAISNQNFVVQDVTEQENYISCGFDIKSEIVVPIFKNGKNIGQIDIDSHHTAPFVTEDEELLEYICEQVAKLDL